MKCFVNLLLTILVYIGLFSSTVTYTGNHTCRRVRALDNAVHPPPGVNPQVLFHNIWAMVISSEVTPEMFAQVYPRLSDICFSNFADHKLSKAEYKEFVTEMYKTAGVTADELPDYESYSTRYAYNQATFMMNAFGQEFISILNKSGNMASVFKMAKDLYLAEYIAGESRHLLGHENEPITRKRAMNLYSWIISGNQNISKKGRSYGIIQENKDFIIANGTEIAAYSLITLFATYQQEVDDLNNEFEKINSLPDSREKEREISSVKGRMRNLMIDGLMYSSFIANLYDKPYLQEQMQLIRAKIKNMFVDEKIKAEILSCFPMP